MLIAIIVLSIWLAVFTFAVIRVSMRVQSIAAILSMYLDNQNKLNQQFQLRLGGVLNEEEKEIPN